MDLREELYALLRDKGAALVGAADIRDVTPEPRMPVGVSVALPLPRHVVEDLKTAPTLEYRELYHSLNRQLNGIVSAGAALLHSRGFHALAQTTDCVRTDGASCSPLPHKSVAVRAGLGWIGRSGLLITEPFGGAVRLSSLLTDAPLEPEKPQWNGRCGACRRCVELCPAGALTGMEWRPGMERDELLRWVACNETQIRRMREATGVEQDLCGLCFAVCPHTQRYLQNSK